MASQLHIFISDQNGGLRHRGQASQPTPPHLCHPCPPPGVHSLNNLLPWFWGVPFAYLSVTSLEHTFLSSMQSQSPWFSPNHPGHVKASEGCRVFLERLRGRPGSAAVGPKALKHPGGLIWLKVRNIRGSTSCSKADFICLFTPTLSGTDFKMVSKPGCGLFV